MKMYELETFCFTELGCAALLACGCVCQPGSSLDPIVKEFLWRLPHLGMIDY